MEYVYFFREIGRPYVKIGMSKNEITERFTAFKTYAPLGAYIVGYIKTENSVLLEKQLHEKFKNKRLKGEFFNITDDEVFNEINKYDKSFGELVYMINSLINDYGINKNDLHKTIQEKFNKLEESKIIVEKEILEVIELNKGKHITNTDFLLLLKDKGLIMSHQSLGLKLKSINLIPKNKRINDKIKKCYVL